jgi:hypothetical protein
VKILVQDTESGKYLAGNGRWSVDADQAEDFITANHALYVAGIEMVQNFQVFAYYPFMLRLIPLLRVNHARRLQTA